MGKHTVEPLHVDIGLVVDEHLGNIVVTSYDGNEERSPSQGVQRVHRRSVLKQTLHDRGVALTRRNVERRGPVAGAEKNVAEAEALQLPCIRDYGLQTTIFLSALLKIFCWGGL